MTIRARHSADAPVLEVIDTGVGIPAEEQHRLFERFTPTRRSERGEIQGIGRGLTMVRAVAEAHGGSATLTSTPGAGTTVRITLPAL